MTSLRDTQKSRVYRAEDVLRGKTSETARRLLIDAPRVPGTDNVTIEACQQYVDHLTQSAWFQRRWGRRQYKVRHKVYGRATWSTGNIISAPPWARDESVLLHEVAHGLTAMHADHGPEFAGVLLTLVEHRMGKAAAAELRAAYKAKRVRYTMRTVPKPDASRVRQVAKPVRVPSATVAAKRATEREERKATREQAHAAAGFAFPVAGQADPVYTFADTPNGRYALIHEVAEQAAGKEPIEGARIKPGKPIADTGLWTTKRGGKHVVTWTARVKHPGSLEWWEVVVKDQRGKVVAQGLAGIS